MYVAALKLGNASGGYYDISFHLESKVGQKQKAKKYGGRH